MYMFTLYHRVRNFGTVFFIKIARLKKFYTCMYIYKLAYTRIYTYINLLVVA